VNAQAGVTKIDTSKNKTSYSASGGYGITIDSRDNIWLGGYSAGNGFIKFNKGSSVPNYYASGYNGLGLSSDTSGNIWVGTYTNNGIVKVDQDGKYIFRRDSGGYDAHGACGDSDGNMWVVNNTSGTTRVFDKLGNILGTFKATESGTAYSYSDMTGLNRAMIFRSGVWYSKINDGLKDDQHWGRVDWSGNVPSTKQSIEVYIGTSNDLSFSQVNWLNASYWNSLSYASDLRMGRYLQIKVKMRSSERGITPVLSDLRIVCD
ncbi:MAG: hypothetical protein WCL61_03500, partial [bacterium]